MSYHHSYPAISSFRTFAPTPRISDSFILHRDWYPPYVAALITLYRARIPIAFFSWVRNPVFLLRLSTPGSSTTCIRIPFLVICPCSMGLAMTVVWPTFSAKAFRVYQVISMWLDILVLGFNCLSDLLVWCGSGWILRTLWPINASLFLAPIVRD
jgi:hypothetical protein